MAFLFLKFLLNNVYIKNMMFFHPQQNGCNWQIRWVHLHTKNNTSSQIPYTIAPVHTDSYSKTVHIVLLRARDNSIHVHFVLDKTFLIPSRWDMLDSQIQNILNPPQTDTYLISQIQDILDSQETTHSWLSPCWKPEQTPFIWFPYPALSFL